MTIPTLISYTETSWVAVGNKTSASITWLAGDIIVVIAGAEGAATLGTPTATGLTFTVQKSNAAASTCNTLAATAAPTAGGSATVSVTYSDTATQHWGFGVWVFRATAGVGNSAEQHTSTLTVGMAPAVVAHSAVVWGVFDFSATAVQTITPTPTNTRQRVMDSGRYSLYVADLIDQSSTGSVNYGISGAATGPSSIVVVEIKQTILPLRPLQINQAVNRASRY